MQSYLEKITSALEDHYCGMIFYAEQPPDG
jgi:hypothetical protein